MANGAANSTAIQIQAGSRNHARRRSQPEFVFMASSRKDHFVGWIPADVDSFARVIVAVTARDLGDRVCRLYTITMANGAANSTAIQIQAGSRNHARRRSQPEFVFMASSRKDHFVGWIPADEMIFP